MDGRWLLGREGIKPRQGRSSSVDIQRTILDPVGVIVVVIVAVVVAIVAIVVERSRRRNADSRIAAALAASAVVSLSFVSATMDHRRASSDWGLRKQMMMMMIHAGGAARYLYVCADVKSNSLVEVSVCDLL